MIFAVMLALLCAAPANAAEAPGAPGAVANWTAGDKDGFGSARPLASKVWFTLQGGELTEVYAPDLGTPSFRDLQFVVSDGKTFSERETDVARHTTRLADARSLTYRQTSTTSRWRLTKTYVTDPARSAVLVSVRFESLTGKPYRLYVLGDPALSNTGDDDSASGTTAYDKTNASALATTPALTKTSVGYMGASDGWTDLRDDYTMDWTYDSRRRLPATSSRPGRHRSPASSTTRTSRSRSGSPASPTPPPTRRVRRSAPASPRPQTATRAAGTTTCMACAARTAPPASRTSTTHR